MSVLVFTGRLFFWTIDAAVGVLASMIYAALHGVVVAFIVLTEGVYNDWFLFRRGVSTAFDALRSAWIGEHAP